MRQRGAACAGAGTGTGGGVAEDTLVDFAVVVFREEGQWQVGSLPHKAATATKSACQDATGLAG